MATKQPSITELKKRLSKIEVLKTEISTAEASLSVGTTNNSEPPQNLILKPIPDFPTYFISKNGECWSNKRGKWTELNTAVSAAGYLRVALFKDGKTRQRSVKLLVAQIFGKSPPIRGKVKQILTPEQSKEKEQLTKERNKKKLQEKIEKDPNYLRKLQAKRAARIEADPVLKEKARLRYKAMYQKMKEKDPNYPKKVGALRKAKLDADPVLKEKERLRHVGALRRYNERKRAARKTAT